MIVFDYPGLAELKSVQEHDLELLLCAGIVAFAVDKVEELAQFREHVLAF